MPILNAPSRRLRRNANVYGAEMRKAWLLPFRQAHLIDPFKSQASGDVSMCVIANVRYQQIIESFRRIGSSISYQSRLDLALKIDIVEQR